MTDCEDEFISGTSNFLSRYEGMFVPGLVRL